MHVHQHGLAQSLLCSVLELPSWFSHLLMLSGAFIALVYPLFDTVQPRA
jgi:hypothetical protein